MNLYVHFPFCRAKCAYCALASRAGASEAERARHVARLVREIAELPSEPLETVYFGGGTPARCDLAPLFTALAAHGFAPEAEFTVELHPLDATPTLLASLRAGGVNRVSLGVQILEDAALAAMGRGYTADAAENAFRLVRAAGFENAGFDLIAGWPGVSDAAWRRTLERALALEPVHVSCYALIREPGTRLDLAVRRGRLVLPADDVALAQIAQARAAFTSTGIARYEISNYARNGFACRHNCAVWRGEDYVGLGEGACGRRGLVRTRGTRDGYETQTRTPEEDALERALFALRTREGLDPDAAARRWPCLAPLLPAWRDTLAFNAEQGLLARRDSFWTLTPRGAEVCDAVLAELMP